MKRRIEALEQELAGLYDRLQEAHAERDAARADLATLRARIEALRFQGGLADPSTLAWALRVLDGKAVVRPPCHTCDGTGCEESAPGAACTWRAAEKEVPPHNGGVRGVSFPCEGCGKKVGSTLDNGFYRCNACGYPGK